MKLDLNAVKWAVLDYLRGRSSKRVREVDDRSVTPKEADRGIADRLSRRLCHGWSLPQAPPSGIRTCRCARSCQ
jgi:hypothetical protein